LGKGTDNKEDFESVFNTNFIPVLTVMMRRSCYENIGGFDEKQYTAEDYDYWMRLARVYKFKFIDVALAKWRMNPGSMSKNVEKMMGGHWRAFNKKENLKGVSIFKILQRRSFLCLEYAQRYADNKDFFNAAKTYAKALLIFPIIGFYVWPPQTRNIRFSFLYRTFRIYGLMFKNFFKGIKK
jgi:hypothetical protein